MPKINLTEKRTAGLLKEMAAIGIIEPYTNYRLSEKFLRLFIDNYVRLEGKYAQVQDATVISLFQSIKQKKMEHRKRLKTIQAYYSVARAMIHEEKVINLIEMAKIRNGLNRNRKKGRYG